MTSSEQDGAAAAAEQLGSLSLGESVGMKDDDTKPTAKNWSGSVERKDTEPTAKNGTPAKSLCNVSKRYTQLRKEGMGMKEAMRQAHLDCGADEEENVQRKENDTEPAAKNGTTPTKLLCSACGKKSNTLKKCNGCKCVWYCDKECQNKHRKEHKRECRPIMKELDKRGGKLDIGTELDVGPLGKLPPQDECPICMHVLPVPAALSTYESCCGKSICGACNFQHQMKSGDHPTCAFCRTAVPRSDEEILAQLQKRIKQKDPTALNNLAMHYGEGGLGLSVDQAKCIDLMRQSAGLGYPSAQFNLGTYHDGGKMGLERNKEEALKHFKEAAEGGDIHARHNLACKEVRKGNYIAAMRHARLSASGGLRTSVISLISAFDAGWLRHGDLAETLQAFYLARAEVKSEGRDKYIVHLKMIGEYDVLVGDH